MTDIVISIDSSWDPLIDSNTLHFILSLFFLFLTG